MARKAPIPVRGLLKLESLYFPPWGRRRFKSHPFVAHGASRNSLHFALVARSIAPLARAIDQGLHHIDDLPRHGTP